MWSSANGRFTFCNPPPSDGSCGRWAETALPFIPGRSVVRESVSVIDKRQEAWLWLTERRNSAEFKYLHGTRLIQPKAALGRSPHLVQPETKTTQFRDGAGKTTETTHEEWGGRRRQTLSTLHIILPRRKSLDCNLSANDDDQSWIVEILYKIIRVSLHWQLQCNAVTQSVSEWDRQVVR